MSSDISWDWAWRKNWIDEGVLNTNAILGIPNTWFAVNDGIIAAKWEALACAEVSVPELVGSAWNLNTWAAAAAVLIEEFVGSASWLDGGRVANAFAESLVPKEVVWAGLLQASASTVGGVEVKVSVVAVSHSALFFASLSVESESRRDLSWGALALASLTVPDSWLGSGVWKNAAVLG